MRFITRLFLITGAFVMAQPRDFVTLKVNHGAPPPESSSLRRSHDSDTKRFLTTHQKSLRGTKVPKNKKKDDRELHWEYGYTPLRPNRFGSGSWSWSYSFSYIVMMHHPAVVIRHLMRKTKNDKENGKKADSSLQLVLQQILHQPILYH